LIKTRRRKEKRRMNEERMREEGGNHRWPDPASLAPLDEERNA